MLEFDDSGVPLKKVDKPYNPDNGEFVVDSGARDISNMQKYLRRNLKKITIDKSLIGDVTQADVELNRKLAVEKARLQRLILGIQKAGWKSGFDEAGNLILENPKYAQPPQLPAPTARPHSL
jgi:hypothetical protein